MTVSRTTSAAKDIPTVSGGSLVDCSTRVAVGNLLRGAHVWQDYISFSMIFVISLPNVTDVRSDGKVSELLAHMVDCLLKHKLFCCTELSMG